MIEVKNLVKKYGNHLALDQLSFQAAPGEIVGLLGNNGAGKSTTMNILTGYLSYTSGQVVVNGYDILRDTQKAKASTGYLPEQPPLYLDMTVENYLGFLYELKRVKLDKKRHIGKICEAVQIDEVKDRLIKNLSKGYKQRVGIAQALLGDPAVLIFDEPTVGLDPKQNQEIRKLIQSLRKKHTVILSSHILSEIQSVCDRILVIDHGRCIADGTPDMLYQHIFGNNRLYLWVEGKPAQVASILKKIPGVMQVGQAETPDGKAGTFYLDLEPGVEDLEVRRSIFYALSREGNPILELKRAELSLENLFLELTKAPPAREKKG